MVGASEANKRADKCFLSALARLLLNLDDVCALSACAIVGTRAGNVGRDAFGQVDTSSE